VHDLKGFRAFCGFLFSGFSLTGMPFSINRCRQQGINAGGVYSRTSIVAEFSNASDSEKA
jgi:hypothetical protein